MGPFLQEVSGEAGVKIISALATGGRYIGIMNLPNQGQIANLSPNAVVETFGVIDANGTHSITIGELSPGIHSVVSRHVINQELIVEAALTGDKSLALRALLNDPLVWEIDGTEEMLDEIRRTSSNETRDEGSRYRRRIFLHA